MSSELDQQTNDITTQLASTFRITDDQEDPPSLSAVNENPTQHIEKGDDVISLHTPPECSFPSSSQTSHSLSTAPEKPDEVPSSSHQSDSLDIDHIITTGRGLTGILKKHKDKKTSKKVKFAITPTKVVKRYRSTEGGCSLVQRHMMCSRYFPSINSHKSGRSLKQVVHVMAEDQCVSGGNGNSESKGGDKAGNQYDESFPIVSKSSFNDLIEYIRQSTACEVKTHDPSKPQVRQREDDIRAWDYRNIWCTKCYGKCPVCDTFCCVYEELRSVVTDEECDPLLSRDRGRSMGLIEVVGAYVKDTSTFSLCTAPGGCGRHVCPSCCGVCPDDWCQDVQCKVSDDWCLFLSTGPGNWADNHFRSGVQGKSLGGMRLARAVGGAPCSETIRHDHDQVTTPLIFNSLLVDAWLLF
ncbi:uncharacterized protein BO80DRAFT_483566 [Aspergillus ibericus CBS 121593]|uniref:Uncharacterized protein n=1 Tax=Aspergillus ibericus CBS 121593 TaxID=1448316 RepID=A0A395GN42_9EURO|nr:hypothetical protein BO80DRAFT_483566 [Aspergillus ibericus CBS 121593]RAK96899.1 hypothetical protein BO80DRAFT_483566 [Aspergillus ibericus CBS 121593]